MSDKITIHDSNNNSVSVVKETHKVLSHLFKDNATQVQKEVVTFLDGDEKRFIKEMSYLGEVFKNNKLSVADGKSLQNAFMYLMGMGMSLNPLLGHATITTRKAWVNGQQIVVAEPNLQYKGKVNYLKKHKVVKSVFASCVYKDDTFKINLGTEKTVIHEPNTQVAKKDDNIIGAYAIATLPCGDNQIVYMDLGEIHKRRANSTGYQYDKKGANPWKKWFPEMAKKTAVNKLFDELQQEGNTENFMHYHYDTEGNVYDKETGEQINNNNANNRPSF